MLLGCIGDDFTGSSDLGNTLAKAGMRTVQYCGVPDRPAAPDVEAGIVALKSRTLPVHEAVAQSLEALSWLQAQGCRQFLFKYCSTFDSTDQGNIGPVAEALADALKAQHVIFCPAFPEVGRRVYQGHLFVGDRLLNESGMEAHPLTPMKDADLRRVLKAQSKSEVGHLPIEVVWQGADAIRAALSASSARFLITDAIRNEDLLALGHAAADQVLITGGSGIALGLPENFRREGLIGIKAPRWQGQSGRAAVLAGSCSRATLAQIAQHRASDAPMLEVTPDALMGGEITAEMAAAFVISQAVDALPLIASSAAAEEVSAAQSRYGRETLATRIEDFFAELAALLIAKGVTRLISAGGETSGAVVKGLGLTALEIGPEIAPGVPALRGGPKLVLALKSGNFGDTDFFRHAADCLQKGAG